MPDLAPAAIAIAGGSLSLGAPFDSIVGASAVVCRSDAQTRRFFPDDPIWREPMTQDVKNAVRYEPDLAYQTIENLFWRPGDKVLGQRAKNVNTVDEVPDGPYFVNRAGRMTLTPAIVARAANTSNGPAPGKWTVVSAKSDGVTPGFTIRDSANQLWFVKFDPPGWRAMATGSEIVAAKLFWAAGYHTAEYHIAQLVPSNLVIGKDTRITPPGEMPRPMNQGDIMWLLGRADRDPDGSYRVILSKATPGRPVGRIKFHGTRADDPNDVIPHEHRRELRGYFVFAAWLNHVDAKGINSLSTLVTENGRSFIRHYLLDFGSALGSAAIGPREGWEGYEALVEEPGEIGKRALSLGFNIPVWRTQDYFESPSIGRLPRDHSKWNPEEWWPHITNAAFRHMRPDDTFWAATKARGDQRRDDSRRRRRGQVRRQGVGGIPREGHLGSPAADPADVPAEGESDRRSRSSIANGQAVVSAMPPSTPRSPIARRDIGRSGTRSTTTPTRRRSSRRPRKRKARW